MRQQIKAPIANKLEAGWSYRAERYELVGDTGFEPVTFRV